jgi:hypothetical protein
MTPTTSIQGGSPGIARIAFDKSAVDPCTQVGAVEKELDPYLHYKDHHELPFAHGDRRVQMIFHTTGGWFT